MAGSRTEPTDSGWSWLYSVGSAAAAITGVIIPIQIVVFVLYPPPSTVSDYFALFQDDPILGLVSLDLLLLIDYVLLVPILLALYVALRRISKPFMAIGTILGLVGIAAYFASNTAVEMLLLSDQYAAATTDTQRGHC